MTDQFHNNDIGALFKNTRRKHDKAPVLVGTIELSPKLVRYLNDLLEEGEAAILSLSGWKNVSAKGLPYYTVKAQRQYISPDGDTPRARSHDDMDL